MKEVFCVVLMVLAAIVATLPPASSNIAWHTVTSANGSRVELGFIDETWYAEKSYDKDGALVCHRWRDSMDQIHMVLYSGNGEALYHHVR